MSNKLRRDLHPAFKVIDSKRGTVEFVASDESIDSAGEVIRAAGWQFNRFQKNAPFVNSHDYSSIENLLGQVVDYAIKGNRLVETVQFAVDVPSNLLAQKAFDMVAAGYCKSVSVGFIPTKFVTRYDQSGLFDDTLKDLGMGDLEDSINCIYLEQEQLELSLCCIGANANAVALKSAYRDGIFDEADLLRWPSLRSAIRSVTPEPRRSYSFSSQSQTPESTMSRNKFLASIAEKFSKGASPSVQQAAEDLEFARRGQSEGELIRASGRMRLAMAQSRRRTAHDAILDILSDDLKRRYWNTLPRCLAGVTVNGGSKEFCEQNFCDYSTVKKSLTVAPGSLGATLLPIDVSDDIFSLLPLYGAFADLGVTPMTSAFTKFPQVTGTATAVWITPSNSGAPIPADTTLTGASLTPEANSLGVYLPCSRELLVDEKADLSAYIPTRLSQAIAAAVDYACFQGNGANDTTNGSQTGIFVDNTIAAVNAALGNTTINNLERNDFLNVIGAVAPGALQRPCRWFINPAFIPQLMSLVDSKAHGYLLVTPAQSGDGEWYLCGFPVTWSPQNPAASTPGSKIAAFGEPKSYMVALRQLLELMLSDGTGFSANIVNFRAIARAFCQTREATGFATLALANG